MASWVKIVDGVVVQKQPYYSEGFIEASDDVVCGFLYDAESEEFSAPPAPDNTENTQPEQTLEERLAALELQLADLLGG